MKSGAQLYFLFLPFSSRNGPKTEKDSLGNWITLKLNIFENLKHEPYDNFLNQFKYKLNRNPRIVKHSLSYFKK